VKHRIRHRIAYLFDSPVFLEPHILRMEPRAAPGIRVLESALSIDPLPIGQSTSLDPQGNLVRHAWFSGLASRLLIESDVVVEVEVFNPYEFLLAEGAEVLPPRYSSTEQASLAVCLGEARVSDVVQSWAGAIRAEVQGLAVPFVTELCSRIHRTVACERREAGASRTAEETLRIGNGACRDQAVLFVAGCRAVGLAARFVSGYALAGDEDERDLHAWAEVCIPGVGWRGFDPSMGLAVCGGHIPLAAAAHSRDAAALSGTYRGAPALKEPETKIEILGNP